MNKVTIVGSSNIDLVIDTKSIPKVGETLIGEKIQYFCGGKGNNQAIASSRSGAEINFFSAVGKDDFGEMILNNLRKENISTKNVYRTDVVQTGLASVFRVESDNAIIVIPGANSHLDKNFFHNLESTIKSSDVLLVQLEVSIEIIRYALEIAKKNNVITILNPAPYSEACLELLPNVDIITPNEIELSSLINLDLNSTNLASEMVNFEKKFNVKLVVTQGSKGVSFVEDSSVLNIPAPKIKVIDTTGAGDTFNGVLATYLSNNYSLKEAIKVATLAASISTTKNGAQDGMPTEEKIEAAKI